MKTLSTLFLVIYTCFAFAQETPAAAPPVPIDPADKARVFITSSESWEMAGGGGGSWGNWGSAAAGGARPQTAEIIKTFGERCPALIVNNIQGKADYIILLDHEGGKGLLRHKNKVAVFERLSGDAVVSKSTLSLGGSVQEACEAITRHWATNRDRIRRADPAPAAAAPPAVAAPPPVPPDPPAAVTPKVTVNSTPAGADIEVDGNFMGSTPSAIELPPGDHVVVVKKAGFKAWERKLKLTGGEIRLAAELEAN